MDMSVKTAKNSHLEFAPYVMDNKLVGWMAVTKDSGDTGSVKDTTKKIKGYDIDDFGNLDVVEEEDV